jgi:hypothetical protein
MIFIGNFNKNSYLSLISIGKPKNFVVFAYTYVSRSQALFNGDFCMNLYFVDSDEVMKWGNEALTFQLFNFYEALNNSSQQIFT